jgi:hypothetical protein
MKPGDPSEPTGPEDALGEGKKRGDYRQRIGGNESQAVPIADGGGPVTRYVDEDGKEVSASTKGATAVVVDSAPVSEVVPQAPRAAEIGDAKGQKGGVDTDPRSS